MEHLIVADLVVFFEGLIVVMYFCFKFPILIIKKLILLISKVIHLQPMHYFKINLRNCYLAIIL